MRDGALNYFGPTRRRESGCTRNVEASLDNESKEEAGEGNTIKPEHGEARNARKHFAVEEIDVAGNGGEADRASKTMLVIQEKLSGLDKGCLEQLIIRKPALDPRPTQKFLRPTAAMVSSGGTSQHRQPQQTCNPPNRAAAACPKLVTSIVLCLSAQKQSC